MPNRQKWKLLQMDKNVYIDLDTDGMVRMILFSKSSVNLGTYSLLNFVVFLCLEELFHHSRADHFAIVSRSFSYFTFRASAQWYRSHE